MRRHAGTFGVVFFFCVAFVSMPLAADDTDDAKMMAQLAQIKETCEQNLAEAKKKTQDLQAAKAQTTLPPEKTQQVEQELHTLNAAIAKTEAFLRQPLPTSKDDQETYLKSAMGAIAATREYQGAVAKDLGIDPASRVESVLSNLGSAEDFKTKFGAFDQQGSVNNAALDLPVVRGPNTNFFGAAGQLPPNAVTAPQVSGHYQQTNVDAATEISDRDHGVGGGIMLEGAAGGLDPVSSIDYDGGINALVLNGSLTYFVKISPWSLATMCREIGADRNGLLGVSETGTDALVFGDKPGIYKGTDLAYELMMADKFLGDVIFARPNAWPQGYKFPGKPPSEARIQSNMLVRFAFGNFQFAAYDGQLALVSSSLEVRMMPVSKAASPTGQMLPDYNAMDKGWTPPDAFVANAAILTEDNMRNFRQEALIQNVFADGETAAILRSLKQSGQNLNALADKIDSGGIR